MNAAFAADVRAQYLLSALPMIIASSGPITPSDLMYPEYAGDLSSRSQSGGMNRCPSRKTRVVHPRPPERMPASLSLMPLVMPDPPPLTMTVQWNLPGMPSGMSTHTGRMGRESRRSYPLSLRVDPVWYVSMSPQESSMDIMPLTLPSPMSSSSHTFLRPMRGVPDIMCRVQNMSLSE